MSRSHASVPFPSRASCPGRNLRAVHFTVAAFPTNRQSEWTNRVQPPTSRFARNLTAGENREVKRSGTADLPLHGGRVPLWLATRMTELSTAIVEQIVVSYGPSEFLTRLSDPFWFQALGAVMGMDWHSSGITTSVMGALRRGLNP